MGQSPAEQSPQSNVAIDFMSDFEEILRATLKHWHVVLPATASQDEVILGFYDAQHRRIPMAPRRYYPAPSLVVPPEHQGGYDALVAKMEAGADLNSHLSTLIERADRPDGLLIDWNIYHFHLGQAAHAHNPRFTERTGPLLFAMLTRDSVYGLAIIDHGSWACFDLLESAHRHFPDLMAHWRAEGVVGLSHVPTEEEVLQLRAAGIVSMIQLSDGTVYVPPGMGFNTTGRTSVNASMWRNQVVRQLHAVEEHVRANAEELAERARAQGHPMVAPYRFRLHLEGNSIFAVEESARVAFQLGTLN